MHAQAYLADSSIGRDLQQNEGVKVMYGSPLPSRQAGRRRMQLRCHHFWADLHDIRQATKRYVERWNAFGLVLHQCCLRRTYC